MLNERRMKMKKNFLSIAFMAVFMLMATNSQAQSWSDLFNKDNISKVVNAITGNTKSIDMTGTWNYQNSKYWVVYNKEYQTIQKQNIQSIRMIYLSLRRFHQEAIQ